MRLRSVALLLGLNTATATAQAGGVGGGGRTIDEGTFSVMVGGASSAQTENFKVTRGDNGLITATGQLLAGPLQITSSLTVDSLGTPVKYDIAVRDKGSPSLRVSVAGGGGRLTALSSNQRGDQSMHEYPCLPGQCRILDNDLVHQLYFVALGKHTGPLELISPRDAHKVKAELTAKGLEPVVVAGRSLTGTHYTLTAGAERREFWVDGSGRLLRVEIPSRQIVATREEPPR